MNRKGGLTGLSIGSRRGVDDEGLVQMAQRAEELGYDSLWIGESWGRDVFTVLTMIACHTSRIRLGTGIATIFTRTPALTAQSIASLDLVSKGRAMLGLGTSGRIVVEQWHGVKYEKPLQRTREYVEIIRRALAGERVDYQGELFQLGRFRMPFSPVQERIPIYLASLGPRNLALTGALADGWLPIWVHLDHLRGLLSQVEEGAAETGRSLADVTVAPQILCYVATSPEEEAEARRLLRAHMAYYIGGMGTYYWNLFKRYGYADECQQVREAWAVNDRATAASAISDEMLDNMTVYGDADRCREALAMYRDRGVDMPLVGFPNGSSLEAILRTLEALAPAP